MYFTIYLYGIMTGLFLGFIIAVSNRSAGTVYNQELINNNSGLVIYNEWTWCDSSALLLAHRHYALWKKIWNLKEGSKLEFMGCSYKVESYKILYNSWINYSTLLGDGLRLQTCDTENGKTVFIKAKNQKKRLIKQYKKVS